MENPCKLIFLEMILTNFFSTSGAYIPIGLWGGFKKAMYLAENVMKLPTAAWK